MEKLERHKFVTKNEKFFDEFKAIDAFSRNFSMLINTISAVCIL